MSYIKKLLGDTDFEKMRDETLGLDVADTHIYITGVLLENNLSETYNEWLEENGRALAKKWAFEHGYYTIDQDYSVEFTKYLMKCFIVWVVSEL